MCENISTLPVIVTFDPLLDFFESLLVKEVQVVEKIRKPQEVREVQEVVREVQEVHAMCENISTLPVIVTFDPLLDFF